MQQVMRFNYETDGFGDYLGMCMSDDGDYVYYDDYKNLASTVIDQHTEIEILREQNKRLHEAAKQVEAWWLEDGRQGSLGAPFCIFAIRSALGATQ